MAKCGISFCNQIRFSNIVTVMNIRHPELKDNWSSKGCCLHRTHLIFRDILHINALKSTHNNHTKWNKLEHHCYQIWYYGQSLFHRKNSNHTQTFSGPGDRYSISAYKPQNNQSWDKVGTMFEVKWEWIYWKCFTSWSNIPEISLIWQIGIKSKYNFQFKYLVLVLSNEDVTQQLSW